MQVKGLTIRKFFLYGVMSLFLFGLSSTILFILHGIIHISIAISNFIADLMGLIAAFLISREKIFYQSKDRRWTKAFIFFCLRLISIILFSIAVVFFYEISMKIAYKFRLFTDVASLSFLTKALMIPFTVVINFFISYLAIEWLEKIVD